jgi:hypothetical protein
MSHHLPVFARHQTFPLNHTNYFPSLIAKKDKWRKELIKRNFIYPGIISNEWNLINLSNFYNPNRQCKHYIHIGIPADVDCIRISEVRGVEVRVVDISARHHDISRPLARRWGAQRPALQKSVQIVPCPKKYVPCPFKTRFEPRPVHDFRCPYQFSCIPRPFQQKDRRHDRRNSVNARNETYSTSTYHKSCTLTDDGMDVYWWTSSMQYKAVRISVQDYRTQWPVFGSIAGASRTIAPQDNCTPRTTATGQFPPNDNCPP